MAPRLAQRGLAPVLEPGRYLVGDAGVLIARVLGNKVDAARRFAETNRLATPHHVLNITVHAGTGRDAITLLRNGVPQESER